MQSALVVITLFVLGGIAATTDYQCWNFKSTDEIRERYIKAVNKLRSNIVNGDVEGKNGKCPAGKNIYKLFWDCLLENEAQKVVDKCDGNVQAPNDLAMVIKKIPLDTCNTNPLFKKTVEEWWNVVKNVDVDQTNPPTSSSALQSFATVRLSQHWHTVMQRGLVAHRGIAMEIFLWLAWFTTSDSKNCPQDQAHMSSDSIRKLFEDTHNMYRSAVARGTVRMGNNQMCRNATQMWKLKYDCELEKSAYSAAKDCSESDSKTASVDELWKVFNDNSLDATKAANQATDAWYKEIEKGYMKQITGSLNMFLPELNIPNFAKMVWDSHKGIGCAVVRCTSATKVVCHYSPAVVRLGNPIYAMGPTCNRCKLVPTTCLDGLCVQ
ncbi:SCP-like protein [Ancylostoma caninum]|uniref:SCP-like protein n=1 Tax=Ancylostoma caninum TaxID=29170 RepID=A0A368GMT5_ANCCA|nr:SCP-like protein [Ancylostoma caninum]